MAISPCTRSSSAPNSPIAAKRLGLLAAAFAAALALSPADAQAQATAPAVQLGSLNVGTSTTGTATFTFSATTTVASISVLTKGAPNLDFTLNTAAPGTCTAVTYNSGDTCTVGVSLTPANPGMDRGAVVLKDSGGNALATAYLQGTGLGSQAVFTPAPLASFSTPTATDSAAGAFDGLGNLYTVTYAAGTNASTIYKIDPSGTASVFAMITSPCGLLVDGAGNIFFIANNSSGGRRLFIIAQGSTTPVAVATLTATDLGLAIDSAGNLYFSDTSYNIIKLAPNTYTPTTVATNNGRVVGMYIDRSDNLYFADYANSRLKVIYAGTSTITDLTGNGLAAPNGVVGDAAGNIYVSNYGGAANIVRLQAGTFAPTIVVPGQWSVWVNLAPNGDLYFAQEGSTLFKLSQSAPKAITLAATKANATSATASLAVASSGNLPLTITVPVTGSNPSVDTPFLLAASTTCPQVTAAGVAGSVASGTQCNYDLQFVPTAAQTYTGNFQLSYLSASGVATSATSALSGTGYDSNYLGVTLSHTGTFYQGFSGTYTIAVQNTAPASTTGTITVSVSLPSGLTASTLSGTGWTCSTSTITCTSSTAIAASSSSTSITLTVNIASNAANGSAVASASGGGATNTPTATDPTTITSVPTFVVDTTSDATGDCTVSGSCTLRAAITAVDALGTANAAITFSPTVFATAQTITLTGNLPTLGNSSQPVSVSGPGQTLLTISGADTYQVFNATALINISALTLAHGHVTTGNGACLASSAATSLSSVTVQNCQISGSTGQGAGIYSLGSLTLTNVNVNHNAINVTGVSNAAGIFTSGGLTMSNSLVTDNTVNCASTITGAGLVAQGSSITITDSTIARNAGTSTANATLIGGGAYIAAISTLSRVVLTGNSLSGPGSVFGGGLYTTSTLTLTNSTVNGNSVASTGVGTASGAGVYMASGTVRNNTISGNSATSGTGATRGGGLAATGTFTAGFTGNLLDDNTATSGTALNANGAGIYFSSSANTVDASAGFNFVSNNSATGNGAGIWTAAGTSIQTLKGFTLANNNSSGTGSAGGGYYGAGTRGQTLAYITAYGNSADTKAGGLDFDGGTISTTSFTNLTVTGNSVRSSGVGGLAVATTSSTINFSSNTITGNTGVASANVNFGHAPAGFNNIADGCSANCPTGATNLTASTNLGTLAYNGGGARTLLPLAGSNALAAGTSCTGVDERGYTRPNATGCDIGAVNTSGSTGPAPITVTASDATVATGSSASLTATVAYTGTAPSTGFFFKVGTLPGALGICTGSASPLTCTATVDTSSLTAGPYTITAIQTGSLTVSGNEGTATLTVGAATVTPTKLVFTTAPPSTLTAGGNAGTVQIALEDASNNVATTAASTGVTLTVSGPSSYSQTYNATTTNGVASFNLSSVTLAVAGTYTYTASSSGLTSAQSSETVNPGPTAAFTVTIPSPVYSGTAKSATVTAIDTYLNKTTAYSGTIHFISSDGAAALPGNSTLTSGTGTFSVTFNTTGSQSFTATDTLTASITGTAVVNVGAALVAPAAISWTPSSHTGYTPNAIGTDVLDATDSTPGTITYTATLQPSGSPVAVTSATVLANGTYTLTAIFTPTDTTHYTGTTATITFTQQNMDVFFINAGGTTGSLYDNGTQQSAPTSGGGIGAAVDASGNVWSINTNGTGISVFSKTGTLVTSYTGLTGASSLAIDGSNHVVVTNSNNTLTILSSTTGAVLATTTDTSLVTPTGVAIDISGNVWVANSNNTVDEIIGGAAPAAPLATAVVNGTPGGKP